VARTVADDGAQVRVFQRGSSGLPFDEVRGDVADPGALARAVDGVDAVVHLAARVSVAGEWAAFARTNVDGTRLLLDAARSAGVGRVVFVSSPSVAHAGEPLVGAGAGPADPDRTRGHYSRSKAMAERLALAQDTPGFAVIAVRPHLVWGPGDTQLVGRIVERARSHRLALVDDGAALIDTTYVDNAADAIVAALHRADRADVRGRAFVVSNGEPRPVAEMVARICAAAGVPGPRRRVPFRVAFSAGLVAERMWAAAGREDDPPMTSFLAEQLATAHWFAQRDTRERLGWRPRVSLAEGFDRLAASYR
jgi:nucleoside-diphosphate-sugar epimerase